MFAQFLGKRRNLPVSSYTSCGDDPYWSGVVLMMHMDGTNNLQTFIDETGKTVTTYGDARVRTDNKKFGGSAAYFDGTGDYLSITDNALALGSGDWTIEFWFYQTARSLGNSTALVDARPLSTNGLYPTISTDGNNKVVFYTNTAVKLTGTTTVALDAWYHVALVKSGSVVSLFVNGNLEASAADTNTYSGSTIQLGNSSYHNDSSYALAGYIDEVRITKGVARYDSNPTALLMHFDNDLTGVLEETGKTLTKVGSPVITTAKKVIGNSSVYFSGSSYYTLPSSSDWSFGTEDFTVEFWVYVTATGGSQTILGNVTHSNENQWAIQLRGANVALTGWFTFFIPDSSNFAITSNEWNHVALSRNGSSLRVFINGGLRQTVTNNTNFNVDGALCIGYIPSYYQFTGYLDELRISKGIARYTANFTPSTTAFVADAYTKLLCHFEGAHGITVEETGKMASVYGNTSVSSTQSKFGGYSGYFDGNGDYISIPWSNDFAFGTGDFTVECWVNTTSANTIMIVDNWYGNSWQCFMSAGKINFYYNGYVSGSTLINDGQWHHLAWVRKSGVMSGFVDGIEEFKTPFTYNAVSAAFPVYIGAQNATSVWFEGYIDELRITRGKALYSSSGDVLLLHFDGMVSPADFTDTTGKALTAVGNPTYSAQHKVGTSSVYFDGTGASLYTDSPVLDFGTGDYTVECWVLFSSTNAECVIGANSASQFANSFMILKEDVLRVYHGGAALLTVSFSNDGLWHHIAAVRASGMVYLYIDGESKGNISGAENLGQYRCTIGNAPAWSTTYAMHGYIDELRVSKGIARYNGTFTPSVTAFTADAYTTLLHHFNGVIGSGGAAFLPEETGKAITLAGNTAISATQSKFGDYSGYFPAASSLTVAAQSDLFLANTDFTIEFWLRVEDNIPNYWCGVILVGGSGVATLQIEIEKAAKRLWSSYGNSYGTAVVVGTGWKHIALVNNVSGNTFKIYVDGVLDVNVASYFQSAGSAPCYVTLGTPAANEDGNRYIDELRISKGIARYTANFTPPVAPFTLSAYSAKDLSGNALPPTAPFTYEGSAVGVSNPIPPTEAFPSCRTDVAIAKTILEITFEDGFVDTSINPKTITASGGSSIVTFNGRKCGYFPGANDGLSINHADFNFTDSAVDFTIECWMYWKGLADSTIFYIGATNFVLIQARTTGDGIIDSYYPNWTRGFYSENSMLQALSNKWLHFALVRHNSSMKLYLDGVEYTALAHVTAFPANTTGTTMSFGGAEAYFDNYRVIKGYAKYLANFTPA